MKSSLVVLPNLAWPRLTWLSGLPLESRSESKWNQDQHLLDLVATFFDTILEEKKLLLCGKQQMLLDGKEIAHKFCIFIQRGFFTLYALPGPSHPLHFAKVTETRFEVTLINKFSTNFQQKFTKFSMMMSKHPNIWKK